MDHGQILTALRETPDRLRAIFAGASAEDAALAPAPGEWSAREVLVHLRVDEAIFGPRILLMAVTDQPLLQAIDPGTMAHRTGFPDDGVETTLAALALRRAELVALLERLDGDGWQRQGIHESSGVQTIADIAALLAGHDVEHLAQIASVLDTIQSHAAPSTH